MDTDQIRDLIREIRDRLRTFWTEITSGLVGVWSQSPTYQSTSFQTLFAGGSGHASVIGGHVSLAGGQTLAVGESDKADLPVHEDTIDSE